MIKRTYINIFLGLLLTKVCYSQSLNKHGSLITTTSEYVSTNGNIGTTENLNSNGKISVIPEGLLVFDNLAPAGTATFVNYPNIRAWGQQFTPTTGGFLTNVKINLYRTNYQDGIFIIELWSDNGSSGISALPNTKLATLYTSNWNNLELNNTSAITNVNSFTENYNLVNGTSYWLVVNQDRNGPAARRWATTGSGLGQTANINSNGVWVNSGSNPNLGAQISVEQ
ncbi:MULTISPECIES: hypothetical protein [unclassified Flavobacterium]|uniref:hypothetical protein n=1 Tax=unclassified Flavobacterium TaxID=196869 RepID=UPI003F9076CE